MSNSNNPVYLVHRLTKWFFFLSPSVLFNADCLKSMKLIPDHSVDLVICDLPYGQTHNKWDSIIPFDRLWKEYNRIIKDNGTVILFGNGMFTADLMQSNRKMWRYNLIWEKTNPTGFLNANRMPLRSHEDICVFYKSQPVYHPQKTSGHKRKISSSSNVTSRNTSSYESFGTNSYDSTERFPTSVWTFPKDTQKSSIHPTQKPLALIEALIKTYSDAGNLVLDNCMGSGTTGVACKNTGRRFIGIELDKNYFYSALTRIQEET